MTAADYREILDEEVERARKADASVDAEAVAEAIFVRASLMDAVAASGTAEPLLAAAQTMLANAKPSGTGAAGAITPKTAPRFFVTHGPGSRIRPQSLRR